MKAPYFLPALCLFLSTLICFGSTANTNIFEVGRESELIEALKKVKHGGHIVLRSGTYKIKSSLVVPSNVRLQGNGGAVLEADQHITALIDLKDADNVSIDNIILRLTDNNKGIYSSQSYSPTNIQLTQLTFEGNLHYQDSKEKTSSHAIYIKNAQNISVSNNYFTNTFGGIYLSGNNLNVRNNHLNAVNFGNVVATGVDITIDGNTIIESGKGSKFSHPSGDAITIGGGSESVSITNNTFKTGYCYMLWAHGPLRDVYISNNYVSSGVTSGFMLQDVENATVENNLFDSNLSNGLAFTHSGKNIKILNNVFKKNPLYIGDSIENISIEGNDFVDIASGAKPIKSASPTAKLKSNTFTYINKNTPNDLVLTLANNTYTTGSSIMLDLNKTNNPFEVQLKNKGNEVISLYGFPQVIVSESVLPKKSRGPKVSGNSEYKGISVLSRHQPKTLILKENETSTFYVSYDYSVQKEGEEFYLNIPNSLTYPEPYWLKVKLKN